jgi:hypothetical protein
VPAPMDFDAVPRVQGVVAAFRVVCAVNKSNWRNLDSTARLCVPSRPGR